LIAIMLHLLKKTKIRKPNKMINQRAAVRIKIR